MKLYKKLLIGALLGSVIGSNVPVYAEDITLEEGLGKMWSLVDLSKQIYVYEIDNDALFEAAYHGIFDAMDDDSVYYNEAEFSVLMDQLNSKSIGPGLVVNRNNGDMVVISVYKHSAAEAAGVMPGDILTKVDQVTLENQSDSIVNALLSGIEGSRVAIEIQRKGVVDLIHLNLTRERMNPNQITYENLGNGIGYIKVVEFSQANMNFFDEALTTLVNQQITSLIIDVRDNAGGEIDAVVHALDKITPVNVKLMEIDYRSFEDETYYSEVNGVQMPMVILANERSVGGSEIFSSALQKNAYAVVVGQPTMGDGGLQWITPLDDGSGVKLTIGQVLTADAYSFDDMGVQPTHVVANENHEIERIYTRFAAMNSIRDSIVGMKDEDTLGAQQRLNYLGYTVKESGYFGRDTEYTLAQFQLDNGLLNSGILNWETKGTLDEKVREKAAQIMDDLQLEKAIELLKQ